MFRSAVMCAGFRICITVAAVAATVLFAPANAQTSSGAGKAATTQSKVAKPAWKDLTGPEKEALAPLASEWDSFDRDRKQKWLEVAKKYPQLSPDGKTRMHQRMAEFGKLSPEQRQNVRENFRKAYELPIDQRQALIQEYNELPVERKQELSEKAAPPIQTAPKSARESRRAAEQKKAESK